MQALLNSDGSGRLFVNTYGGPFSWEVCAPDLSSCAPFGAGGELTTTAGAPPNTVFRVSSGSATGLSPVWRGDVVPAGPPSVSGTVRANERVTPLPGQWSGGWDGELSAMRLSACGGPTWGSDCVTLTHEHFVSECRGTAAVLDPSFVGDYLRVADRRPGTGPHFMLAYAVGSPYGLDMWTPGPTVSLATVGRIARPTGPRSAKCGASPLNSATISRRGVATVECGLGCRAILIAKRGRRGVRLERKLPRRPAAALALGERRLPLRGPTKLRLPRRSMERLGPGRVHIAVRIDSSRVAGRTVRVPAHGRRGR